MMMNFFLTSIMATDISLVGVCGLNNGRDPQFKNDTLLFCDKGNCCSASGYCGTSSTSKKTKEGYCNLQGEFKCQPQFSDSNSKCRPISDTGVCGINKGRDKNHDDDTVLYCANENCCSASGYCGKSDASDSESTGYCNTNGDFPCQPNYSSLESACPPAAGLVSLVGVCGLNKGRDPKYSDDKYLFCAAGNCCSGSGYCGISDTSNTSSTGYCNLKGDFKCAAEYSALNSTCAKPPKEDSQSDEQCNPIIDFLYSIFGWK
eukprot:NODE_842_length_3576_cov_0.392867.p1 type:complete len:261 gc:universal NODE_842_length_3576_cov_0.392867:1188-1970(+)